MNRSSNASSLDPRILREKEFHNEVFADERRRPLDKYYSIGELEYRAYKQFLDSKIDGSRFLEFGCGPWGYVYEAAISATSASAIDISEVAIELGKRKADDHGVEIDLQVMDAEAMEYPDDAFDLICGSSILHHLDLEKALTEIDRVLAPGGCAVFSEPLGHNPIINAYRRMTPSLRTPDEHPLLKTDLDAIRKRFPDARVEFYHLSTFGAIPLRNTSLFQSALRILNRIDQTLFRLYPPLAKHAWFCLIYLAK